MEKKEVPIWEKANLTIDEAAAYFGIGTNKLRDITSNPDCEFVIWVGTKRLIKRKKFEKYLEDVDAVLASGDNRHSGSGEKRQFWSNENRHLQIE